MRMQRRAAALLLMLGAACAPPADDATDMTAAADTVDPAALVRTLSESYATAYNNRDAAAVAALYAEDAVSMPPDTAAVVGRTAIQQGLEAEFATTTQYHIIITPEQQGGGAAAVWDQGTVTLHITPEGGQQMELVAKYIVVSEPQADGTWKIKRVIWNNNTAARPMM